MDNNYNYYDSEEQTDNYQYYDQPLHTYPIFPPPEPKKTKRAKRGLKVLAVISLAVLFGFVSSVIFLTTNFVGGQLLQLGNQPQPVVTAETYEPEAIGGGGAAEIIQPTISQNPVVGTIGTGLLDVSDIVEMVMPSVVSITNLNVQQVRDFFRGTIERERESAGTGIILGQSDTELLIVTNYHVVEGSDTLTITFINEQSVEAYIKGFDAPHDLAIVAIPLERIDQETMAQISLAVLGESTRLRVGEPAIAIGNALGFGQSVTAGVISAVATHPISQDGYGAGTDVRLIQTDAAINPGNSGGPLVNARGEVIGINSQKLVGHLIEGVGYAIPISEVNEIITHLMNLETRFRVPDEERGFLGISGVGVTPEGSRQYNIPVGVFISEVHAGSGAYHAGITMGSVITAVEGVAITGMSDIQNELQYHRRGSVVSVTIQVPDPSGQYLERIVEVTLGGPPQ